MSSCVLVGARALEHTRKVNDWAACRSSGSQEGASSVLMNDRPERHGSGTACHTGRLVAMGMCRLTLVPHHGFRAGSDCWTVEEGG